MKKFIISVIVLIFALIIAALLRIKYIDKTKGKCLHPYGGCNENRLCVDSAVKCDFFESINYYFFR